MLGTTNARESGMTVIPVQFDNQTVNASTYADLTFDVSQSGKTPVGIVGYGFQNAAEGGSGSSFLSVYAVHLSGSSANIGVRNYRDVRAKVAITLYVLYEN